MHGKLDAVKTIPVVGPAVYHTSRRRSTFLNKENLFSSTHLESTMMGVSSNRRSNSHPGQTLKCLHLSMSPSRGAAVSSHGFFRPVVVAPLCPLLPWRTPPSPPPLASLPSLPQFIFEIMSLRSSSATYSIRVRMVYPDSKC